MKFSNIRVIVIVGATSGVGEAIVKRFIYSGWQVIGIGRNNKKLREMRKVYGSAYTGFAVDIRNESEVQSVFSDISTSYNRIDLLVNSAAVFKMGSFIDCSYDDINNLVDINLKGVIFSTLEALKIMTKSEFPSRIINIASVAAIHGIAKQSIYCSTKYGLNGFSEALNQELIGEYDISITTLFPGGIDTPLWNKKNPYPGERKDEILQPGDIVKAVEYISELESRVVLKNMTIFPSNEWH